MLQMKGVLILCLTCWAVFATLWLKSLTEHNRPCPQSQSQLSRSHLKEPRDVHMVQVK